MSLLLSVPPLPLPRSPHFSCVLTGSGPLPIAPFSSLLYGNNIDENVAMGNGREPVRTQDKLGDIGRGNGGTDSNSYETEKAGMVRAHQTKRLN